MAHKNEIDAYIESYPENIQQILTNIRHTIADAVPDATEVISYAMPTFRLGGKNMVHFAAFEHHIGLYATPDGHAEFEPELSRYKRGKGSVQLPLDQPIPYDLISRIATFRAKQLKQGGK